MKKKLRILMLTAMVAITASVSGIAAANLLETRAAATDGWSESTLAETYLQGDVLELSARTYTVGGETVTADCIVTYPDGTTSMNSEVRLSIPGQYTVSYTATVGGRVYKDVHTLTAKYRMVGFSDAETTVSYGAHELAPTVNGLLVRLKEGDKLVFNEVIDMSTVSADETLFEAFATADTPGNLDFRKLFVQVTDMENPDNYFKVRYIHTQSSGGGPWSYVLAGGNGQPMTGYELGTNTVHVEGIWGASIRHSFLCQYGNNNSEIGQSKMTIRYNPETKEIYAANSFVTDFDNPKYFNTLWDGFVSGKVQLSVWAEDYDTASANFVVTKVAGLDLTKESMEETTPPAITVNTEYEASKTPAAEVGRGYPVPEATAWDTYNGSCAVTTKVYYNYTSQPSNIRITDGKFTPEAAGRYAIVYTAKDYMGNTAEEIVWVDAVANLSAPTITLNGSLPAQAEAGKLITIPGCSVSGGSGNSVVKVYVNNGVTEEEVVGEYRPSVTGTHMFKYVATDYIGQTGEKTVAVNVTAGDKPLFINIPHFPNYFIAGAPYQLPKIYANDYSSGTLEEKLANVQITDGEGTHTFDINNNYVPTIKNNLDKVTITYSAGAASYSVQIPTILAKDSNGIHVDHYFDLTGATITLGDASSQITATQSNASWTFGNSLIAEDLEILMQSIPDKATFDGWKIVFTDSVDASIQIQAFVYKSGDNTKVVIGKTEFVDESTGFTAKSKSNRVTIGYADGSIKVNGAGVGVTTTVSGEEFVGFPSNKVYVSVSTINAKAGTAYNVLEVNGQKIMTMMSDRVAPKIVVLGEEGGTKKIGGTAIIPAALAGDTLDPNVTFTVTVTSPSYKPVTSKDGVLLTNADPTRSYEIDITEYGAYSILYEAKDSFSGRTTSYPSGFTVDDETDPVITFLSAFKTTAKKGDTLVIPNFTVSDNLDTESGIVVLCGCIAPSGELVILKDSNAIVATQVGVYTLEVMAMDSSGNLTVHQVKVTVTE